MSVEHIMRAQPCMQGWGVSACFLLVCCTTFYIIACYICPCLQAARLRDAEPALHKAAERAAAAASMSERVEMNAAAEERRARQRQEEVCGCSSSSVLYRSLLHMCNCGCRQRSTAQAASEAVSLVVSACATKGSILT
jgi:hypothetical protein